MIAAYAATMSELSRHVRLTLLQEIPEAQKADNTSAEVVPAKRPYSPDPALITELNRLSIPSVNNLTQRLSEILPSLKRFCAEVDGVHVENIEDDEEVERVLDDIHKLGQRPPLKDQHSTMRLRALPGKSNLVVVEDDVYEELTHQKEKEKDFVKAALGEEVTEATNDSKPVSSGTDGQKTLSVISAKTGENRKTSLTEPEAPCAAVIRPGPGPPSSTTMTPHSPVSNPTLPLAPPRAPSTVLYPAPGTTKQATPGTSPSPRQHLPPRPGAPPRRRPRALPSPPAPLELRQRH